MPGMSLTTMSNAEVRLPPFVLLPTEIQDLILKSCEDNDRVCLSLTWYLSLSSLRPLS
jgi:hypothetical protein